MAKGPELWQHPIGFNAMSYVRSNAKGTGISNPTKIGFMGFFLTGGFCRTIHGRLLLNYTKNQ